MSTLVFGFYGEGPQDYRFTMKVVERTLEDIAPHWEVLGIEVKLAQNQASQTSKLIQVAEKTSGYSVCIFHLDADAPNEKRALEERFWPGIALLEESNGDLNRHIVPVIPVRCSEAWMLADPDAFRLVVGANLDVFSLGFPHNPHDVEAIGAPKLVLSNALRNARPGQRRQLNVGEVYLPLARRINLARLRQIPSYRVFRDRIEQKLREIHVLE